MGHDIGGFNKDGEQISYVRFGMGNHASYRFYSFFDAYDHHGGVSGKGASVVYSVSQIEKALEACNEYYNDFIPDEGFRSWEREEILNFIISCLETAQKEGNVRVCFA